MFSLIISKFRHYWVMTKPMQTGLLLVTAYTGYISANAADGTWITIFSLLGSIFLTVGGSTILNMVYDRDIDSRMQRTSHRPLPAGNVSPREGLILGMIISGAGIFWAFSLSFLFGLIVFAGLFFDVVIYTVWLKRRTAWSIVWGGISGGMPILAGRALGTGQIDMIGILLAFAILLWIPTHILTFSMIFKEDYDRAGIPTFPSIYGFDKTRVVIALSSIGAAFAIGVGIYALGLAGGYLRLQAVFTVGMLGLSIFSIYYPSEEMNLGLFKYASMFILGSMVLMVMGT